MSVLQTHGRCDTLLETVRTEQRKVASLEETLAALQEEKQQLVGSLAHLERELTQQRASQRQVEGEREGLLERKAGLREELATLNATVATQRAKLEAASVREGELGKQLHHLTEVIDWC